VKFWTDLLCVSSWFVSSLSSVFFLFQVPKQFVSPFFHIKTASSSCIVIKKVFLQLEEEGCKNETKVYNMEKGKLIVFLFKKSCTLVTSVSWLWTASGLNRKHYIVVGEGGGISGIGLNRIGRLSPGFIIKGVLLPIHFVLLACSIYQAPSPFLPSPFTNRLAASISAAFRLQARSGTTY
jgi:hypothetical protein